MAQLAMLAMTSLLFGKMTLLKTLQLSLLHCTGKLAKSGQWLISHEVLTANPLSHLPAVKCCTGDIKIINIMLKITLFI